MTLLKKSLFLNIVAQFENFQILKVNSSNFIASYFLAKVICIKKKQNIHH